MGVEGVDVAVVVVMVVVASFLWFPIMISVYKSLKGRLFGV